LATDTDALTTTETDGTTRLTPYPTSPLNGLTKTVTDTETTQAAYSQMLVQVKVELQRLIALDALTMTVTEYQT
jgi:hypothetical protein